MKAGDVFELAWDCDSCLTENPGSKKFCTQCGAPQPEGVKFHEPKDGYRKVTDPEKIKVAKAGPDVHCPSCGTRNANGATVCTQCGGELKGGKLRKKGDRLDTKEDEGVETGLYQEDTNSKDDAANASLPSRFRPRNVRSVPHPVSTAKQNIFTIDTTRSVATTENLRIGGVVAFVMLCFWFFWMLFINTTPVPVTIDRFHWELNIPIEEYRWVSESGWSVPAGGIETGSEERVVDYESVEKCETTNQSVIVGYDGCNPHLEDSGNGYAEVVEDSCPVYEDKPVTSCQAVPDYSKPIMDTYYFYDIQRWTVTRYVSSSGDDNNPEWPSVTLANGEREGFSTQFFTVYYIDEKNEYHSLISTDWNWFTNLYSGQVCQAERNGFGGLNPGIDCSVQ